VKLTSFNIEVIMYVPFCKCSDPVEMVVNSVESDADLVNAIELSDCAVDAYEAEVADTE